MKRRRLDDFTDKGGDTGADNAGHVTGTVNRQQAMNALEMEEWRKTRSKKKYKIVRQNGKLVIGVRMIYGGWNMKVLRKINLLLLDSSN